jgi:hypothetical protein
MYSFAAHCYNKEHKQSYGEPWDGKSKPGDTFSGCCGSIWNKRAIRRINSLHGIRMITTKVHFESTDKYKVHHVKTKNGNLTFILTPGVTRAV